MSLSEEEKQRVYEEERIRARARLDHSTTPLTVGAKGCAAWYRAVTVFWILVAAAAIAFAIFQR